MPLNFRSDGECGIQIWKVSDAVIREPDGDTSPFIRDQWHGICDFWLFLVSLVLPLYADLTHLFQASRSTSLFNDAEKRRRVVRFGRGTITIKRTSGKRGGDQSPLKIGYRSIWCVTHGSPHIVITFFISGSCYFCGTSLTGDPYVVVWVHPTGKIFGSAHLHLSRRKGRLSPSGVIYPRCTLKREKHDNSHVSEVATEWDEVTERHLPVNKSIPWRRRPVKLSIRRDRIVNIDKRESW